jgi:hypothetical protein
MYYIQQPRRPFKYKVFATPKVVIDLIDEIVEAEKQKHVADILRKEHDVASLLPGTSNFYGIQNHEAKEQTIIDTLLPLAEEITGEELEATALYGVREYLHGAELKMHFDRRETHVYSFTVTHSKDADWPLRYQESEFEYVDVELEEGQLLFYEGADYLHGRPEKFKGNSYMNWYVHYKPIGNTTQVDRRE